jgi:hypothetical protein
LHWGREHLLGSEEEQAAYCKACDIINSSGYWYSVKVKDSSNVVKSKIVTRSRSVFESSEVTDSFDIVNSEMVAKSN